MNFQEMLKSGTLAAYGRAKYLGGHPELDVAEKSGELSVTSLGLFFNVYRSLDSFFVAKDKILLVESQTGEQIAQNGDLARRLAMNGFAFAFKTDLLEKQIFLTVSYYEDGYENMLLFETQAANRFATALAEVIQDSPQSDSKSSLSPFELLKQISELRATGVLSAEEFAAKKKDLLSRI